MSKNAIHLQGNYYLTADDRNIILLERRTAKKKDGEEERKVYDMTIGHYGDLEQLARGLALHQCFRFVQEAESLQQVIDSLAEFAREVQGPIKSVKAGQE